MLLALLREFVKIKKTIFTNSDYLTQKTFQLVSSFRFRATSVSWRINRNQNNVERVNATEILNSWLTLTLTSFRILNSMFAHQLYSGRKMPAMKFCAINERENF